MGDKPIPPPMQKRDIVTKEPMPISFKDGNPLLPHVQLNDKLFEDLCDPWRDALVTKLLGKKLGYHVMFERLQRLWKPQRGFDILDIDNGYYMVKIRSPDRQRICHEWWSMDALRPPSLCFSMDSRICFPKRKHSKNVDLDSFPGSEFTTLQ